MVFERKDRKKIKKPNFLFGDKIESLEECPFDGNSKWLRQVRGRYVFLPKMERSYPLSYLYASSIPRKMEWHLTKSQDGVLLGGLGSTTIFSTTTGKHVTSLLLGLLQKDYPVGETSRTRSLLYYFITMHSEFPCQDFWSLGWVHSSEKGDGPSWQLLFWKKFENQWMKIRLYHVVWAVQHGILLGSFYFF